MKAELLPCPFCGNPPYFSNEHEYMGENVQWDNRRISIRCDNECDMRFGYETTPENKASDEWVDGAKSRLLEKWNKRIKESKP